LGLEDDLHTERLVLEPIGVRHARLLYEQLQDIRLYRYYGGAPPQSIEELERRYAAWSARKSPDGTQTWLNYAVRWKNGAYAAWVQATIADHHAVIGYDVFPEHWRKSVATEACRELVRNLREEHGVSIVAAVVDAENEASIRLLRRLGFGHVWSGPSADMPGRIDHRYELPATGPA
jgi:ribosomal-protein-alanine N-acetyltransferase